MSRAGSFVIVRGALGVGKTTIARALGRRLRARVVSIDAILERYDLEEWEHGYISEASFRRANAHAARIALPLLRRGEPVIFDGNFYHRSQIEDLVARLDFSHQVITLRAPLAVCIDRDRGRRRSFGAGSVRAVYRKAATVDLGIEVDAEAPVDVVVQRIVGRVRAPRIEGPADRPAR